MRTSLVAAAVCALAGCGGQSAFKDYRDEEARLLTVRTSVQDLSRASTGPGHFAPMRMGGETIPPEYNRELNSAISSAETFCEHHSDNKQYDTVQQILEMAREIEAMNAKAPSQELTGKIQSMNELAQTLEMRSMTEEEEAGIVRSIK